MPTDGFNDAHRSLTRWLAFALGSPPWRLALEPKDVENRPLPSGYVIPTDAPRARRPRTTIPQGDVDWSAPFAAYLVPATDGSRNAAILLASGVTRAFAHGVVVQQGSPPVATSIGGPERIPLWNYDGVPSEGSAAQRRPPANAYGYAWADPYAAEPRQDPDDGTWSVLMTCTLAWRAGGRVHAGEQIAAGMPPHWVGEPGP